MKRVLTSIALSVFLLSGCSFNKTGIIQVNDKFITKAQFNKEMDKEINNSIFKNFGGADNFVKSDENFSYYSIKSIETLNLSTSVPLISPFAKLVSLDTS